MAAPAATRNRLEGYDLGGVIAKGSFGVVYKAVRKSDGRVFALKQVNLANMTRVDRQLSIDEARVLSQLHHPNVIKHYDSFVDAEDRLNILMEYASKGNVATLIKSYHGKPMPEDVVWRILIQALLGLNHIHSRKIIHRDIKALNLFIDAYDNIKIGDLGIARTLSMDSDMANTVVGTPYYLAPEICEEKPYGFKSDMWALGVVLYECCMGRYPFDAQNPGALIRKILKGQFAPMQGPFTAALTQIVTSCLAFKPEARPDTNQLLHNHALVAKSKALGLDLNPRPSSAMEDKPVYEGAAAAAQQQQYSPAPAQHPFAGPNGSPVPGGYGSPAQYPYQQGQVPYPPHHRPGSANQGSPYHQQQQPYPGRSPQGGGTPPPDHPFALAGPPGGYGSPHGAQQGYGGYPSPQQQGGGAYGQDPYNPWDKLAVDVNKMHLRESEVGRQNVERAMAAQANIHAGRRDNAKDVLYGGPQDSGPKQQRVPPEVLPPAGGRPTSGRNAGAPFATHYAGNPAYETMAHASANEAWQATYQAPQYGRRRNPELQITGPSLRSTGGRPSSGRPGGYAAAADDATSYVSSTSYYTSRK